MMTSSSQPDTQCAAVLPRDTKQVEDIVDAPRGEDMKRLLTSRLRVHEPIDLNFPLYNPTTRRCVATKITSSYLLALCRILNMKPDSFGECNLERGSPYAIVDIGEKLGVISEYVSAFYVKIKPRCQYFEHCDPTAYTVKAAVKRIPIIADVPCVPDLRSFLFDCKSPVDHDGRMIHKIANSLYNDANIQTINYGLLSLLTVTQRIPHFCLLYGTFRAFVTSHSASLPMQVLILEEVPYCMGIFSQLQVHWKGHTLLNILFQVAFTLSFLERIYGGLPEALDIDDFGLCPTNHTRLGICYEWNHMQFTLPSCSYLVKFTGVNKLHGDKTATVGSILKKFGNYMLNFKKLKPSVNGKDACDILMKWRYQLGDDRVSGDFEHCACLRQPHPTGVHIYCL